MHKRDEIIAAIKRCAEKLGRAPSQAEFRRATKISWYQVYKHFRGMRQAVRAAGLEPGPRGGALDVNVLTLDWARVVRKLGRLPSRAEYSEHGIHHAGTLHARIVWSQMAHKFVLLVKEFHVEREWADVVKIVVGKFPLLETSIQRSAPSIQSRDIVEEDAKATVGRELTRIDTNENREPQRAQRSAEAGGLESLPLMVTDSTDRQHGGMRLGKVVAAALAIEILMAAERSSQHSALSIQPEQSNWQLADGNWQEPLTAKDAEPPHQAKTGLAGGPGGAKEEERQIYHGDAETRRAAEKECHLGPSLAVTAPLVHDDELRRGDLAPRDSDNGGMRQGRAVYGEPLGLAAMAHAPTNELGVLFLFGIVAAELGFRVERVQAAFPDCEAKREVAPGKWEPVLVELELYSRNFKAHRHNPKGCHVILCWKHNWPDCPEWLEVIELSKVVKKIG